MKDTELKQEYLLMLISLTLKMEDTELKQEYLLMLISLYINPLKTSPEYTLAGVYGKSVL